MTADIFKSIGPQSFLLPCPIFLVGTYAPCKGGKSSTTQRKPNIMTAAWGTLCSAQPPALLVAIRGSRHTHKSILANKAFTVNIPNTNLLTEVDYAGIFSATNLNDDIDDKFEQCHFTPIAGDHVDAPYVQECPIVIELKLLQHHDVGTHTLFIGEIMDTKVKASAFDSQNISTMPDIKNLDIPCYIPLLKEYWSIGDFQAKAFSVGKKMQTKK